MQGRSLPHIVRSLARGFGPKPVLTEMRGGRAVEYTWLDLRAAVWALARELIEAGLPIDAAVLIVTRDGAESIVSELAVQAASGVACPVSPDEGADALAAKARVLRCAALLHGPDLGELAGATSRLAGGLRLIREVRVLAPGAPAPADDDPVVEARVDHVGPDYESSALFSSGTGGTCKPISLLQRNLVGTGQAIASALSADPSDTWLPLGPLTHPFVRAASVYAALSSGGHLFLTAGHDPLEAAWLARPTLAVALASGLPAFTGRVAAEIATMTGLPGRLARWALDDLGAQGPGGAGRTLRRWIAQAAGPALVREVVGGNLRAVLAGWGPADPVAERTLRALGVDVLGSYGLAEATGVVTLDRPGPDGPDRDRLLDGLEARVSPDGEVEVRGTGVMYSFIKLSREKNPELRDGWLRTGDRGEVADGHLRITGRWTP